MSPLESLRVALAALMDNKLRSVLTLLGMVIGVGAVISVMSIGRGSSAAITEQIESIGSNLIFVRAAASFQGGVRGAQGSAATLTLDDAQALADSALTPDVLAVAPEISTFSQARAGRENVNTRIIGVTPEYEQVRNFQVAEGRFITAQDVAARRLVAVVGSSVSETLFGGLSPVGRTVTINQRPFRIVGLLEEMGGTGTAIQDDVIVAPITTVQARLVRQRTSAGRDRVQTITVQVTDNDRLEQAKLQVSEVLRERHQIINQDDFTLTSQEDIIQARTDVNNVLTIFLGSIAAISLLVGGIGIMNIMLVSVTERTHEIGIRKAVGAKRRDILYQFLAEATLLSFGGGAIGVAGGWGVSRLLERLTIGGQQVETLVQADIAVLALGVSVAIGLFFGIYPAIRAARLDPIEALRR
ncbi:MAG: ABC transporter permease [Chloroflexi bacterium]|nr:ABC transporter permease [Chloroflexota bacterium]